MLIIDSGVHVWLPEGPDRPWMPGRTAHLPEPLTYQKFAAMMDDAGVSASILVPPSWEGERIDYSLEAAQKYPDRFAVMGRFPINQPEERQRLETWRDQKGMLGVRLTLHHEWDRAWMADGTADWFWPAAERLGIPVPAPAHHSRSSRRAHHAEGRCAAAAGREHGAARRASEHPCEAHAGAGVLDRALPLQEYPAEHPPPAGSLRATALLLGDRRLRHAPAHDLQLRGLRRTLH
jgi:predicted TIM-barrel fold metal-dependent hydrolase